MPLDSAIQPVSYRVEPWHMAVAEMVPLWKGHWLEVGLDHAAVPLDMDMERYAALADCGNLHLLTVRRGAMLIGYLTAVVMPHLHYRSTLFATFDLFYLRPEERCGWRGVSLFRAAERSLRVRGVDVIHANTKLHVSPVTGESLDIGPILEFLGWQAIERTYRKVMRGGNEWAR